MQSEQTRPASESRNRAALRWVTTDNGRVLADSVRLANTFWRRMVGLQFCRSLPAGEVLWLKNCRSVHTAWMRFPIDVFFLDESMCVVEVRRGVRPWRVVRPQSDEARHVIERQTLESVEIIQAGLQTTMKEDR